MNSQHPGSPHVSKPSWLCLPERFYWQGHTGMGSQLVVPASVAWICAAYMTCDSLSSGHFGVLKSSLQKITMPWGEGSAWIVATSQEWEAPSVSEHFKLACPGPRGNRVCLGAFSSVLDTFYLPTQKSQAQLATWSVIHDIWSMTIWLLVLVAIHQQPIFVKTAVKYGNTQR